MIPFLHPADAACGSSANARERLTLMSSSAVLPVQVLREHITGLEAAMTVCLADSGHKPVHKLRTETRRVEALLLLLALTPGLPEHRKEAAALLRVLGKLRRAAGEVRDLDVHRKLLEDFAETDKPAVSRASSSRDTRQPASKKPGAGKNGASAADQTPEASETPQNEAAAELRKHMARERDKAMDELRDLLKARQAKTARASEKLLKVLDPAQDLALPAADLLRDAEAVLSRDGLLEPQALPLLKEDDLHSVRKAAKAARYVAEALPEDRALKEAARGFEALQEAGGQWHDALELTRAARRYFGKNHELTAAFREQRNQKLDAYRAALAARAGAPRMTAKRKPASEKRQASRQQSAA